MHVRNPIKMAADKVTQGGPGPRGAEVEVESFVPSLTPVVGAVHGDGHETSAGGASTQLGGTSTQLKEERALRRQVELVLQGEGLSIVERSSRLLHIRSAFSSSNDRLDAPAAEVAKV